VTCLKKIAYILLCAFVLQSFTGCQKPEVNLDEKKADEILGCTHPKDRNCRFAHGDYTYLEGVLLNTKDYKDVLFGIKHFYYLDLVGKDDLVNVALENGQNFPPKEKEKIHSITTEGILQNYNLTFKENKVIIDKISFGCGHDVGFGDYISISKEESHPDSSNGADGPIPMVPSLKLVIANKIEICGDATIREAGLIIAAKEVELSSMKSLSLIRSRIVLFGEKINLSNSPQEIRLSELSNIIMLQK